MTLIPAACTACLLYDHVLTIDQEVRFVNLAYFSRPDGYQQVERMWTQVARSDRVALY
jgi:hypothetical protein